MDFLRRHKGVFSAVLLLIFSANVLFQVSSLNNDNLKKAGGHDGSSAFTVAVYSVNQHLCHGLTNTLPKLLKRHLPWKIKSEQSYLALTGMEWHFMTSAFSQTNTSASILNLSCLLRI